MLLKTAKRKRCYIVVQIAMYCYNALNAVNLIAYANEYFINICNNNIRFNLGGNKKKDI